MQKSKKQETKKPVAPSQSGKRRGEKEESKLPKILTSIGIGILMALVLGLIVALVVLSLSNKKPEESPFKDLPHVTYEQVKSVIVDHELSALNEVEESRKAYGELIKTKSFIIFYRDEDLKNKEFVEAAKNAKTDNVGVVYYNLSLDAKILGEEDVILKEIEFSDPKLLPFVIEITESQATFKFYGTMNDVLSALQK